MRVLVICLLVFLVGCQTLPFGEKPKDLAYKVSAFEDVVRWGALEKMVLFIKLEDDETHTLQEGLDNIRVTGYESSPLTKINDTRWEQTVVIKYVLTDRQIVRQLVDQQVWESEDEGKTWFRTNPPPVFN